MGERRESKWWDTWGTPVTAIATGFAYGVGYASVSVFASTLDVSATDLGLDLREYLLLTGLTGLSWMLLVAFFSPLVWATRTNWFKACPVWKKSPVLVGCAAVLLLVIFFIIQTVESTHISSPGEVAFLTFVEIGFIGGVVIGTAKLLRKDPPQEDRVGAPTIGTPKVLTGDLLVDRRRRGGLAILLLVVLVVTPSTTLWGAWKWADSLLDDAASGEQPSEGPFPLRLVLQPEVGSATIEANAGTESACVLRVAERVFLGRDAVVVRDVTSFTAYKPWLTDSECKYPDSVPWSTPE